MADAFHLAVLSPCVIPAKPIFVNFPGRCQRHLRHPNHLVGNPPIGDVAAKCVQQRLVFECRAFLGLHDKDRALTPFGIGSTDDRDQPHTRKTPDDGFNLRRVDPFATGLDQILGSALDRQIAAIVDAGEVARIEIAFAVQRRLFPP